MPIRTKTLGALLLSFALLGCATHQQVDRSIAGHEKTADSLYKKMDDSKRTAAVVRNKGVLLVGQEVEIERTKQLPSWLQQPYTYVTADQKLPDILATVSHAIGVPIELAPDAASFVEEKKPLHTSFAGNLKGFFDHLALRSGVYWKYESRGGDHVIFFREETKSFHVYLPSGKSSISSSISLSGTGGSGTVSVSANGVVDAYDALAKSISAIVVAGEDTQTSAGVSGGAVPAAASAPAASSGGGAGQSASAGKVSVNPSLGIVTVTATPPILARVDEYVRSVNDRYARNVMINIKVLNLSLKREANVGTNINDLFQRFVGQWNYALVGGGVLQPYSGTPGAFVLDRISTPGNHSSEIFVQALETIGDVALVTSGQVIAANGQPAPLRVGNEVSYLASSSTTSTSDAGVTVTLTPGKQETGFTANFLPTVLGDNRILLQYQLNLSSLLSLDQISSAGSLIQTPNVATQALQQQAFLKDGQSIVLFGFEGLRDTRDSALAFGSASKNASGNRQMMVIMMEVFSGAQ